MNCSEFALCRSALVVLFFVSLLAMGCGGRSDAGAARIVGYVHGARANLPSAEDATMLTHVNYAFTHIEDGEVVSATPSDSLKFVGLRALKAANPDLAILISIGGWSLSEGFSDAALTEEARARFAESAVRYVVANGIDGVDLDWEYPGQPGAGNTYRPEDRENFTLMLKTLRNALDREAETQGRDRYLLTIATGASQTYLDNTDLRSAQKYLDFINIMTYDFSGAWTDTVWHHTNLRLPGVDGGSPRGTDSAVAEHLRAGVPRHKLVVGVAFYGRGWSGVQGLNTPANSSAFSMAYHDIATLAKGQRGFKRMWDEAAMAPYLWNDSSGTFITFDDTLSLRLKAEYIRDEGLGGAMFWEYNADSTGTLLRTLARHLAG